MEKDRLTRRNPDGGINVDDLPAALEKLAAYEEAEAEGLLVTLPVKIGRKVYRHRYTGTGANRGVVEWAVSAITFLDGQKVNITFRRGDEFFHCEYGGASWRVTYMTRAEAEAALKAREAAT